MFDADDCCWVVVGIGSYEDDDAWEVDGICCCCSVSCLVGDVEFCTSKSSADSADLSSLLSVAFGWTFSYKNNHLISSSKN
jgi:hypothetical protein